MGHSQSYDLRNPETGEKTTVRGVRRVSKEHQTDGQVPIDTSIEAFDYREDELRERIRREQLRKREEELESMRIKKQDREPIIDAYRQNHTPPQTIIYDEFNHYDSLKHPSPVDPNSLFTLKRRAEINEGQRVSMPSPKTRYDQVPIDPSPELPRRNEIPVTSDVHYRNAPIRQETPDYPNQTPIFNGRLSPLPRQQEVDPHPMPRYIPPMSPRYEDGIPEGTHYSKTTRTTTYTISRCGGCTCGCGGKCQEESGPVVLRKQTRITSPARLYASTTNLLETPRSPPTTRPRSTYFYDSNQSNYANPRPSSTYSKVAKLPKYQEIPARYTKSTEIRRETLINPSGYHTISRSSKLPKYDEVPRSNMYSRASSRSSETPVPRSPSLHSLRVIPQYDEVPIQKSPRSVTPVYVPPPSSHSSKVRIIPVQTSPKVPKPPIQLTTRQQEVARVPLNETVYRQRKTYVQVAESRSESPANVVYSFSSKKSPPAPPSVIYQSPPTSPPVIREIPIQKVKESRPKSQSMDKITMTTIPRKQKIIPPADPVPYPRRVEKLYVIKYHKDIPRIPLDQCMSYPRYSMYTPTSDSSDEDTVIIPPFSPARKASPIQVTLLEDEVPKSPLYRRPIQSKPPTPKPSLPRTPTPILYPTKLTPEVPYSPLSRYVYRQSYSPIPVTRNIPVTRPTPSPPQQVYLTKRHHEVPKTPLEDHVARPIRRTPVYSTAPSPRTTPPQSPVVISPSPPPTPPQIYLTRRHPEVPRVPLDDYVARPRTPEPIVVNRVVSRTPPPPPAQLHLTRRVSDEKKTPLEHYVYKEPYYGGVRRSPSPSPSEVTIVSASSLYQTAYERDHRKTPIEHYIRKEPVYSTVVSPISSSRRSPPPKCSKLHATELEKDVRATPLGHYIHNNPSRTISRASSIYSIPRTVTPVSRPPSSLPVTRRESEIKYCPFVPYVKSVKSVSRTTTPIRDSPIPVSNSPPSEKSTPRRSFDQASKSSFTRMPARIHTTKLQKEVPKSPLTTKPSSPIHKTVTSPAVYDQVPMENSANKYTQTLPCRSGCRSSGCRSTAKLPSKLNLTLLEPETPRVVYRPKRCRSSTLISIYSIPIDDEPQHLSELHAEKRMIVGIEDMQQQQKAADNVTYVTVATSSIQDADEALYRCPEVGRHPVYVIPTQTCYERVPLKVKQTTQYVRRSSEESQKKCDVENCTHVEVKDEMTPIVARRRISQDAVKEKENRLTIYVDENDMENVVELADSGASSTWSSYRRQRDLEEKLHYDAYMPTISLRRRPIVSFYDKLH